MQSLLIAKAAGDAFSQSTRFQTSPNLTSLVREARAVTAPNPPLSSSIASPSMPSLTAGNTSPPDIASPSLGSRPSMRRTNREKQMRIPKMVLLASYKSIRESRIVPTKGVLVDSNDTVQGVVNTLLEAFEVFTRNPDSFTLYVPAPINVWLKRSATFSAYKFVRNRMEVELREVPLEAKPQALGGGIQVQSKRRTMTVDLNRDKPMTLRLFYRAEGRPDSPREVDAAGSAGSAGGGVPAPMPAGASGRRPASPTAAAATPSPSTSGVFDPLLLDAEQTQTRVMVFRRSDTVDLILAHGAHTFKLPAGVPWALYAPPPFDVWLEETYAIGHYTFLDSHMNVYIMPKGQQCHFEGAARRQGRHHARAQAAADDAGARRVPPALAALSGRRPERLGPHWQREAGAGAPLAARRPAAVRVSQHQHALSDVPQARRRRQEQSPRERAGQDRGQADHVHRRVGRRPRPGRRPRHTGAGVPRHAGRGVCEKVRPADRVDHVEAGRRAPAQPGVSRHRRRPPARRALGAHARHRHSALVLVAASAHFSAAAREAGRAPPRRTRRRCCSPRSCRSAPACCSRG
jgi:hypothetical protein